MANLYIPEIFLLKKVQNEDLKDVVRSIFDNTEIPSLGSYGGMYITSLDYSMAAGSTTGVILPYTAAVPLKDSNITNSTAAGITAVGGDVYAFNLQCSFHVTRTGNAGRVKAELYTSGNGVVASQYLNPSPNFVTDISFQALSVIVASADGFRTRLVRTDGTQAETFYITDMTMYGISLT